MAGEVLGSEGVQELHHMITTFQSIVEYPQTRTPAPSTIDLVANSVVLKEAMAKIEAVSAKLAWFPHMEQLFLPQIPQLRILIIFTHFIDTFTRFHINITYMFMTSIYILRQQNQQINVLSRKNRFMNIAT